MVWSASTFLDPAVKHLIDVRSTLLEVTKHAINLDLGRNLLTKLRTIEQSFTDLGNEPEAARTRVNILGVELGAARRV